MTVEFATCIVGNLVYGLGMYEGEKSSAESVVVVETAESMHTDWRAHSIFDGCVAVGVGNVHRTVYTCIGLGLFVRVGKRRRETFRIFAVAVIF